MNARFLLSCMWCSVVYFLGGSTGWKEVRGAFTAIVLVLDTYFNSSTEGKMVAYVSFVNLGTSIPAMYSIICLYALWFIIKYDKMHVVFFLVYLGLVSLISGYATHFWICLVPLDWYVKVLYCFIIYDYIESITKL